MAIYKRNIRNIELDGGMVIREILPYPLCKGDDLADLFGVEVLQNGEPVDLTDVSCTGYFIRQDEATVVVSGTVIGNTAWVILPESCYVKEGHFSLAVTLNGGGVTGTMRIIDGMVAKTTTDTIVDPGTLVPSIEDLIQAIDDAIDQIPADYSELQSDVNGILQNALFVGGTITLIPSNSNFNDYITMGNYRVQNVTTARTIANIPTPEPGRLTVMSLNSTANFAQVYYPINSRKIYYRYQTGAWNVVTQQLASTGDTSDRATRIRFLLLNDGVCHLGAGDFYVSGINMPDDSVLEGEGEATRIILDPSLSSGSAVKMGSRCTVKNCKIVGSLEELTFTTGSIDSIHLGLRHGVLWLGDATENDSSANLHREGRIQNLDISGFTGGGITCEMTGYGTDAGINASDCNVYNCGAGINISYWAEYSRFVNINCNACYYGLINNGGNNSFTNCGLSSNHVGVYMNGAEGAIYKHDGTTGTIKNSGHGELVACSINHNGFGDDHNSGYAIYFRGIDSGFSFVGCQIFYGKLYFKSSSYVMVNATNFGSNVEITVSIPSSYVFNSCYFRTNLRVFPQDSAGNPITTFDADGNLQRFKFLNCYNGSGVPVTVQSASEATT